jgi:taurine transport system substrate-binding protein
VAYFLEWPMPFQYAKATGMYEEEMGVNINWVSFDTGTAMSAAMASGDVQLSVSQGVPPFVVATSAGQDLQILDVAVSYADNDNCVVASRRWRSTRPTRRNLPARRSPCRSAPRRITASSSRWSHFGVDISTMEIVDMAPPTAPPRSRRAPVDMVCGWGGALRRMKENGNVLLTGAEKTELGILVFDVTSGPGRLGCRRTRDWWPSSSRSPPRPTPCGPMTPTRTEMLPVIAKDAGMDEEATRATISTFVFPTVEEQLSSQVAGRWRAGPS